MPSFDDASTLVWQEANEPALVIFISPRWRDTLHPDPDGRTLRATGQVIRALVALARGLDLQDLIDISFSDVELTPFHGHLIVQQEGVQDVQTA